MKRKIPRLDAPFAELTGDAALATRVEERPRRPLRATLHDFIIANLRARHARETKETR